MGLYDRDPTPDRGDGPSLRRDETRREPERGDTLRATPFTDEVFADREPGDRASGGRSVSLIVGVVLGVALVGGVGWYAFKGTGGVSLAPGETQTIKADAAPYKMKPDNPGGMQVENQDKLVYDRVAKGNAPNRVESLLPPPEVPKAPPKAPEAKPEPVKPEPAKPTAAPPAAVAPAPTPAPAPIPAPIPAKTAEAPAPKTIEAIVKAANEEPLKAAPAPADPLAAAVAAATGGKAPAVESPKAESPKAAAVQTAALSQAPAAAVPLPSGTFQIQLVSVPSEEAAQSEWKRISGRHKDLFAALTPAITKADLGDKGIYYRLRAGPLADKAAADELCASLAADKVGCIVIKP